MPITATLFRPPNGRQEEITVTKVRPEDADYINEHDIKVSMEELPVGLIAVYFDYGATLDDGTPSEWIEFSDGTRSCEDVITAGLQHIKTAKST